jgi:serine/threonine-protein kinase
MNPQDRYDQIDDLFDHAHELPPDQRAAFLIDACNGDSQLLSEVQKLLGAHERVEASTAFLATPCSAQRLFACDDQLRHPLLGQSVGPYEVKEWLGGGGFGDVYMAHRKDAYRQKVAVKVLRADRDDDDRIRARFELERQLQADFQHEHIVRLVFGGTLESGQPYIVMEYVQGEPITKYCDINRQPIAERLALFRQVCHAVAYAHRYGVIHRDIKPGNILVNEEGQAKLLDFGIAKILDAQGTGVTLTDGRMPLTPEYASPEQFRGEGISTASDVYSLGVVLYELLTGRRPHELRQCTAAECERIVCQEEPRRPSTVVLEAHYIGRDISTADIHSADTLAEARAADPKKLSRLLKGDLDQIVLKTLRKEPADRYPTVETLIDDLDRFEQGRSVIAWPISRRKRAVRWVRRNKTVSGLTSAVAIALIGGSIVSTYFAVRERRQAELEVQARKQAESVTSFIVQAFQSPDPARDGRTITVAEVLDRAETQIEQELPDQVLTRAALLSAIGQSRAGLGLSAEAIGPLTKARDLRQEALGLRHRETLASMHNLALGYFNAGRLGESIRLYEQTLALKRKELGIDDPDTLRSMCGLAAAYRSTRQHFRAIPLQRQTLAAMCKTLGVDHPDTICSMGSLAIAYFDAGLLEEAISLYKQTLNAMRKNLGPNHPDTLSCLNNLALAYFYAGRLEEAIPLYEQTLAATREKMGSDHPETFSSMNNLARAYLKAGRPEDAIPLFEQALAATRESLGADSPETLQMKDGLARSYYGTGRLEQAIPLYEQIIAAMRGKLGAHQLETLAARNIRTNEYHVSGRRVHALPLLDSVKTLAWILATAPTDKLRDGRRAIELATEACELTGHSDPNTLHILAAACAESGDPESAIKWTEKALELLGEHGNPELRDECTRALASYTAMKTKGKALKTQRAIR